MASGPSDGLEGSFGSLKLHHVTNGTRSSPKTTVQSTGSPPFIPAKTVLPNESGLPAKVILQTGDVLVEYVCANNISDTSRENEGCRWQVSSEDLTKNSPYFRALLDPLKFYEGRQFSHQKSIRQESTAATRDTRGDHPDESDTNNGFSSLPIIKLPSEHFSPELGTDVIETFLKILTFNSFIHEEQESFNAELRLKPPSFVARLIELADAFNSPEVVREALARCVYSFGKSKSPPWKFDTSILKQSEDRIRQTIYISRFSDERLVFQVFSHALVLLGSRFWANGLDTPRSTTIRWRHLSDGLEGRFPYLRKIPPSVYRDDLDPKLTPTTEELYYRRQCVLNTITDLQASFLRAYGALDMPDATKLPPTSHTTTITTVPTRHYQCRCGFGNASACDAFHLGQMTRFFALRTRTIFLGSTLIDPDFNPDADSDGDGGSDDGHDARGQSLPSAPPSDVTALISSLKQFPDYQIDRHHTGCGVRRRFLPPLDCIERFVGDSRGLLGVDLRSWDAAQWPLASGSWANRAVRRALVVDVHFSRINAIHRMTPGVSRPDSPEENARLLFTAKRRNWEA
ncbi:hypothetical protein ATEIFO6365_0005027400 [Aspergillus terreus]|uniref:Uncharacterized protein n=1 Tax=Aspergillus terreus TaxID=33178 RepID=A0A5M3Z0W6_ASPTE|nr:hypothetical protein ATETN484_0007027900 [Aspergillus terreus]GFF16084.1 hypothetical protein ATEIFO6365_0005027400 [Aspergillus terreus]